MIFLNGYFSKLVRSLTFLLSHSSVSPYLSPGPAVHPPSYPSHVAGLHSQLGDVHSRCSVPRSARSVIFSHSPGQTSH